MPSSRNNTRCYREAPGCSVHHRRISCLPALFAAIAVLLHAPAGHSIDIPFRDLFLGDIQFAPLSDLGLHRGACVRIEYRYWDIYRMKSSSEQHDYHQRDMRFTGIQRSGRYWYGMTGMSSSLVIRQDNVFTEADRMRGGRDRFGGHVLFGVRLDYRVPYVRNRSTVVRCSGGWEDGAAGSAEVGLEWSGGQRLFVRASTFSGRIDLTEEINGYAFPFPFPSRTSGIRTDYELPCGQLRLVPYISWEVSRGSADETARFANEVFFGRFSAGGSFLFRVHESGDWAKALEKSRPESRLPGIRLSVDHHRCKGDFSMYNQGTRYLHLDDLYIYNTGTELDAVFLPWSWISFGWERFSVEHAGQSFFDTWPFDVWDVFIARRYRLGAVGAHLDTWFIGIGYAYDSDRCRIDVEARYEWWRDSGVLRWLEREDILFPFFFRYISHDEVLDITARYAVQVDPTISIRASKRLLISLSGRIAVPFGGEDGGKPSNVSPEPPGPAEKVTRHGGLEGRISITYTL
jgi:hypothetical protein